VKAIQVISDHDNVATALEALETGRQIEWDGGSIVVRDPILRGHKLAIKAIAAGDAVVKYGSPIGIASQDIPAGAHVHTHNVSSTRGRGDLAPAGRLAEPE
jgi:altronate hydrolase